MRSNEIEIRSNKTLFSSSFFPLFLFFLATNGGLPPLSNDDVIEIKLDQNDQIRLNEIKRDQNRLNLMS